MEITLIFKPRCYNERDYKAYYHSVGPETSDSIGYVHQIRLETLDGIGSVHRRVVDVWILNRMMDRGSRANPTEGWKIGFGVKPNADLLVLIDMHSDYVNGQLVHSIDTHGECWTQDASELFRHYMGPELFRHSLDMAGLKGMILLACGLAFNVPSHFKSITSLVSRYDTLHLWSVFDDVEEFSNHLTFIIGFTGHSVQPSVVMPFMLWVVTQAYIYQMPVETTLEHEIANWTLLCHTPVVLVCQGQKGQLIGQKYIASTPSGCVWGLPPWCGNDSCEPQPRDIKVMQSPRQGTNFLKFHCNHCH
ncbi:hypothetical protein EDD22DRAFT_849087 [Suillus occidentalis]|nr:hypothetical protein EDD22DRAFT_849087 [Suillus occidentalis]